MKTKRGSRPTTKAMLRFRIANFMRAVLTEKDVPVRVLRDVVKWKYGASENDWIEARRLAGVVTLAQRKGGIPPCCHLPNHPEFQRPLRIDEIDADWFDDWWNEQWSPPPMEEDNVGQRFPFGRFAGGQCGSAS